MKVEVKQPSKGSGGTYQGVCPHCLTRVAFSPIKETSIADLVLISYWLCHRMCPNPECRGYVLLIVQNNKIVDMYPPLPVREGRPELPKAVVSPYREEYDEAGRVLRISPKASAALSRRTLQHLIREEAGIKKANLSLEIDELIKTAGLPSQVNEAVDSIRVIGNFAAHPIKYEHTGEIVEVEPGEAEWNLDVLDMLFDFYFVQPERLKARKDALNAKLAAAGKPLLK